jgi:hypothetical protein
VGNTIKPFTSSRFKAGLVILALAALAWITTPLALAQGDPAISARAANPTAISDEESPAGQSPDSRLPGSLNGTIFDESGAVVAGAQVKLEFKGLSKSTQANNQSDNQQTLSESDGRFFFPKVTPGEFQLTVTADGFEARTISGTLHPEETQSLPPIALAVENTHTEVQVNLSQVEVAEEEMKVEEKQRIFGAIPNFYVTYVPNAASLSTKQKYKLAVRTLVDPFTFFIAGAVAGIEQGQNHFIEYGQGVQGYAKRFGASYSDAATDTMIAGAIFPSILKQDPRYFYKGKGSTASRFFYAIAASVICKGDNKRWQPNYSNILGGLASGGISNLYYPKDDRNGLGLTFANAAIGIGSTAIGNVLQEFLVRRFTPKVPKTNQGTP